MNTSILAQELEPLNAQIEQVRGKKRGARRRTALCRGRDWSHFPPIISVSMHCGKYAMPLTNWAELEATELFWGGVQGEKDAAGHLEQLRNRIVQFEGEIQRVQEKQDSLKTQINHFQDDLNELNHEVRDAYAREERRREEFVVEREISSIPYRTIIMPWTTGRRKRTDVSPLCAHRAVREYSFWVTYSSNKCARTGPLGGGKDSGTSCQACQKRTSQTRASTGKTQGRQETGT